MHGVVRQSIKLTRRFKLLTKETLENPGQPRENIRVSAGADWVYGQQAARIR